MIFSHSYGTESDAERMSHFEAPLAGDRRREIALSFDLARHDACIKSAPARRSNFAKAKR
jgi:hypothetical protein